MTITVTFPDGSKKEYPRGITALAVAKSIGPRLAKDTMVAKIDDQLVDVTTPINKDVQLKLLTFEDPNGVETHRHSAAHIFAFAIQQLYPDAKNTIGPAVEEGFYYDFDDLHIHPEDFEKIEAKMKEIVKADIPFERVVLTLEDVKKLFPNNPYKIELATEFQGENQELTAYKLGEDFIDLCTGPHVPSTGSIGVIKLLKIAGAYWRGDAKNKQLARVYGISFQNKKQLQKHLEWLEEAKKRDHRLLGKKHDLFTFSDLVGPGLPLWTPKGTLLRNILDDFVWELRKVHGYHKVEIPHITKKDLYETSGHWKKFADELFKIKTRDGHEFVMKPMNCPHHTQIFARRTHSYKEMPQRYANSTMVYRDEQTGELSGLSRVRSITQDDAHVFCRQSQIKDEMMRIWDIIDAFYGAVGFDLQLRLSLSDPNEPEKYLGTREEWEIMEEILRELARERGVSYVEAPGEAAFYGPKLDFIAKDSLGRVWQVATNQLDMNMPKRFKLFCINEQGEKEQIYMLHAAIMGSIERYMSILIEHFAGKFPLWLSPTQVRLITVADRFIEYGDSVLDQLKKAGIRAELDSRGESVSKKVREAQLDQVNYIIVLGEKEVEANTVTVRTRGGEILGALSVNDFLAKLQEEIDQKA